MVDFKIYLTKKEKSALAEYKKRLQDNLRNNFISLKLFGSRARGERHRNADIDIALFVKELTPEIKDKIIDIECDMDLETEILLSSIIFSESDYRRAQEIQEPLVLNLQRETIELWILLRRILKDRIDADYRFIYRQFTEQDARHAYEQAKEFVETLQKLMTGMKG